MNTKPLKRILRPIGSINGNLGHPHLIDTRYCSYAFQLINAYHIIEKDFKKIREYIELNDGNNQTFSHRIYELILRAATEFETNCTGILKDNQYSKSGNWNITDYFKINKASRLNEYILKLNIWTPNVLIFKPFEDWNSYNFTSLSWYQNYNLIKHDRSTCFNQATLENLVKTLGGLYVILASQFSHLIFSPYQVTEMCSTDNDKFTSIETSIFSIKFPTSWEESDIINFDWENLKTDSNPFDLYPFS